MINAIDLSKEYSIMQTDKNNRVREILLFQFNNQSDGKIGDFSQGRIGDCYFLASLKSISGSDIGAEILKNNIKKTSNNSFKITLPGALLVKRDYATKNKKCYITGEYTITKAEIDKARKSKRYSKGDLDVLLYELAFEKYRKEVIKTNAINNQRSEYGQAGQYVGGGSLQDPLKGGYGNDAIFILTGKKSNNYRISPENIESISSSSIKGIDIIESELTRKGAENLLNKAEKDPNRYAITFSLKLDDGRGKHGYHEVSLVKVEGDKIYFSNPWKSNKIFSITKDEFFRTTFNISIVDLKGSNLIENVQNQAINFLGHFL